MPKVVWVYVEPMEATLMQKLCLRNIGYFAQKSKFELKIITPSSYSQYLPKGADLTE